jgi:hypothetical protein
LATADTVILYDSDWYVSSYGATARREGVERGEREVVGGNERVWEMSGMREKRN